MENKIKFSPRWITGRKTAWNTKMTAHVLWRGHRWKTTAFFIALLPKCLVISNHNISRAALNFYQISIGPQPRLWSWCVWCLSVWQISESLENDSENARMWLCLLINRSSAAAQHSDISTQLRCWTADFSLSKNIHSFQSKVSKATF